jgi:hypothetical protein
VTETGGVVVVVVDVDVVVVDVVVVVVLSGDVGDLQDTKNKIKRGSAAPKHRFIIPSLVKEFVFIFSRLRRFCQDEYYEEFPQNLR